MRKLFTVIMGLISLEVFIDTAAAKPMSEAQAKKMCNQAKKDSNGKDMSVHVDGPGFACGWTDFGGTRHIIAVELSNGTVYKYEDGVLKEKIIDRTGGGKVAKQDEIARRAWEANGKKTTAMVITGPKGTELVTFKVGVEPDGQYAGVRVLGPDGHHYQPWDPKLNALLVAGGYVTDKGVAQVYMNDKAMQNQIALKSDKEVRDRIYKAWVANGKKGPLVFPPSTGHVNNDALGNSRINDHRKDRPQVSSTSSTLNTPPPAAAPGTVSTTAVTNPAVQGGAVRDHRKTGNAAGSVGGVTASGSGVTGKTGGGASGGAVGPGSGRNTQQR